MLKVNQQIEKAAKTDLAILVTGEKGVGKTACAQRIHMGSSRASLPFIKVSAGHIEKYQLAELLKTIKGGTLYIDEVARLNLVWQRKLLKIISSNKPNYFRLIASSTPSLENLVKQGEFIEELYYSLCVIKIKLLSLRERKEDVPNLINSFIEKCSEASGTKKQLTDGVAQLLAGRSWPGNIYELESSIQYAFQRAKGNFIEISDLPVWSTVSYYSSDSGESLNDELFRIAGELVQSADQLSRFNVYEDYKRLVIPPLLNAVLASTGENISRSAKILGITRNTLKKMIRDYEIEK